MRKSIHSKPVLLSDFVEALVAGGGNTSAPYSLLGKFTVLHAILKRIPTIRQVLPTMPQDIQTNMDYVFDAIFLYLPRATRCFHVSCYIDRKLLHESGLSSLEGANSISTYPQGLGVHALTGVAYMQLHLAAGPHPSASQDSTQLATWLHNFPLPARSPRLLPALHYAASMIRQRVSTGLGMRSSHSDIGTDPQDFLCAVRLSVFLVKWLLLMAYVPHEQPSTGKQLVL